MIGRDISAYYVTEKRPVTFCVVLRETNLVSIVLVQQIYIIVRLVHVMVFEYYREFAPPKVEKYKHTQY